MNAHIHFNTQPQRQVAQVKWEVERVKAFIPPGIVSLDRRYVNRKLGCFFPLSAPP